MVRIGAALAVAVGAHQAECARKHRFETTDVEFGGCWWVFAGVHGRFQ